MAYVQSASAHVAFASSISLAYANDNAVTDFLICEFIWSDNIHGGSIAVTDSQGNAWTQIFSSACPIPSTGYIVSSWYVPNCKAGPNTVTATYTGSASITAISFAIHEYANVVLASPVDTYAVSSWVQFAGGFPNASEASAIFTRTKSIDTLHSFFACPTGGVYLTIPYLFTQREQIASGSYNYQLCTYDQLESAAPISNETVNFVAISTGGSLIVGAVIALQNVQSPISRAEVGYSWLTINEPIIGLTDRSAKLYFGEGVTHTITSTLRQRGTAEVDLIIRAGDTYMANPRDYEGCQIYLYDQNSADAWLVFAGKIEQIAITWKGKNGDKILKLSCVNFRKCFDSILVPPTSFVAQTAASIFSTLLTTVAGGVPVKAGTINAGFVINQLTITWDRLSDVFDRLAQQSGCIWDIDLTTLTLYLQPPSTTASPFVLNANQIMWESNEWNVNSQDYRNREVLKISQGGLGPSYEVFPLAGAASVGTSVILRRAPAQITGAWLTKSTEAWATGSFTGQPSPGDTITIGYPKTGASYNWLPNYPYMTGAGIIDPAGHVQTCVAGNSPGSSTSSLSSGGPSGVTQTQIPSGSPGWNDSGGETQDGQIIWQDLGKAGADGFGAFTYTFVSSFLGYSGGIPLNAQFGNVLIGLSLQQTVQNLVDAINCTQAVQGQTFSWPTWECPPVNADLQPPGGSTSITVRAKAAGNMYNAAVSANCANFSWGSYTETTGGTDVGAANLSIATVGSPAGSNIYYTPGVTGVGFPSMPKGTTPSGSGWFLAIQYIRQDADTIVCEDTVAVNQRAAIENDTGKYQVYSSDTTITSGVVGLQQCQAGLAAYSTIPVSFSFRIKRPGLVPGQYLDIGITTDIPVGIEALVNGQYLIQEIKAKLIPLAPVPGGGGNGRWLDSAELPGGGHYENTVTVINISRIFSWLEFWKQMGTGGSGGSGSITLNTAPYDPITLSGVGYEPLTVGLLGSGIVQPDFALGDSFSLTLNNWTTSFANWTITTTALVGASDVTIAVSALPSGISPASCPFNIAIGTEQMTVTGMSGSGNLTWAVTRGQNGTTAGVWISPSAVSMVLFPGDATMMVSGLPAGVTPASCPFNCTIGYPTNIEQVLVTAMSGTGNLIWAVTRAQWGTTAISHTAGEVVTQQFGMAAPIFTGGQIYPGLEGVIYVIQDATGNRPNPNWEGGPGGYALDVGTQAPNGNPNTQSVYTIRWSGTVWTLKSFVSGGALS